jgi:hypothetical protein
MPVTAEATAIRPFRIEVLEEQLAELRRRIEATRWPSKELVADRSQGVQLATLQIAPLAAAGYRVVVPPNPKPPNGNDVASVSDASGSRFVGLVRQPAYRLSVRRRSHDRVERGVLVSRSFSGRTSRQTELSWSHGGAESASGARATNASLAEAFADAILEVGAAK